MNLSDLEKIINKAFEDKQSINEKSDNEILSAINQTIELTDKGDLRVAEKKNNIWTVNQGGNKARLFSFSSKPMTMSKGPDTPW